MHFCDYFDRLEIENGELVRILTARAKAKKMKGRELDVFKEYESGKTVCRNVYSIPGRETADHPGHFSR